MMRALVLVGLLAALEACGSEAAPDPWRWELPREFPEPRVPSDNPMSADKVELGRHLFFDTRLSGNGTQACGSCHAQERAFTDGEATPHGSTGERGRHNAMTIVNAAYNSSQTWASSVERLEDQALVPMFGTAPIELGLTDEAQLVARLESEPVYQTLFPLAFPDHAPFTVANVARAIASFERTIISGNARFDQFVAGNAAALDGAEQRGKDLFESDRLGCARCHGGFNFTSAFDHAATEVGRAQFFNTGLYNVDGLGAYPSGDRGLVEETGDPAHMGRFKPPSLRNIAVTAPYFHDGSAATVADVIDSYARGGRLVTGANAGDGATNPFKSAFITGFTLTSEERSDLIAFLGALTGDDLLVDPAFANPWR